VSVTCCNMTPSLCHAIATVPGCDGGREQMRVILSPGAAVKVEDVSVTSPASRPDTEDELPP